jgi:hypothetical protein
MRVEDFGRIWLLLLDELFQLCDFAHLLEGKHLILLVPIDAKACRILQSGQRAEHIILMVRQELRGWIASYTDPRLEAIAVRKGQLTYPLYSKRDKPLTKVSRMNLRSFSTK